MGAEVSPLRSGRHSQDSLLRTLDIYLRLLTLARSTGNGGWCLKPLTYPETEQELEIAVGLAFSLADIPIFLPYAAGARKAVRTRLLLGHSTCSTRFGRRSAKDSVRQGRIP